MQTVDRRGIHIEQCQGCKGIFLDRGELEQMANAEQSYHAATPPPQYGAPPQQYGTPPPQQYGHTGYRDSPPPYGGHGGHGGHGGYRDSPPPYGGHKKRRKGFMDELFG